MSLEECLKLYNPELNILLNNEPRISNILVSVSNPSDSHELNVTIQYDITGISAPSQAVDVVLFPARV